jgi:hypothetical protein
MQKFKIRTRMKNYLFILLACITLHCSAQDVSQKKSGADLTISSQIDSLKKSFAQNGFVLLKEASIAMESEYEMPVVVPMNEGTWYQIVFVGEPSSKLHEIRMYDYDEKQVYYRKLYGYSEGTIISYEFQPNHTEWHMIKPVQVNKDKKDCVGYIMLLKKVKESEPLAVL